MATISLKKGLIVLPNGQSGEISTFDIIDKALDASPEGGLSVADIRARIKFDRRLELISKDATEIEVDDKELEILRKSVEGLRWIGRNDVINTFVSELYPEAEVTEPEYVELSAV